MKRIMKIGEVIVAVAGITASCFAQGPGTESGAFMHLSGSARAVGMGEAYCAVADDVDGVRYNPGGITQAKRRELQVTHNEWVAGIQNECAGLILPLNRTTAVAGTVQYTHAGEMVKRDVTGAAAGGMFGYQGTMAAVCVAHAAGAFSAGVSVKGIQERIDTVSDTAYACDAGILYTIDRFKIGLMAGNIGSGMQLGAERYTLPALAAAGIAFAPHERAVISADISQRFTSTVTEAHIGGEYWLEEYLAVRAGYRTGRHETAGPGISAGLGFNYAGCRLDYAFMPMGDLGSAHRVSFGTAFGRYIKR